MYVQNSPSSFDLSRDAILVRLRITQLGVLTSSKTVTSAAAESLEADKASVKGYVQVIQWTVLGPLNRVYTAAKAYFKEKTLPWSEDFRILPITSYQEFMSEMRKYEQEYLDEAQKVISQRDELVQNYLERVGPSVAEDVPFPSVEKMDSAFAFETEETPLPSKDFRLRHVSQEVQDEIRDRVVANTQKQIAQATSDIVHRLVDAVSKIAKGERVHKTTLESLNALLEQAPALNLTNDPKITALIQKVSKELGGMTAEEVRAEEGGKERLQSKAGSILDDISGWDKSEA
jgi:hypothetical protein